MGPPNFQASIEMSKEHLLTASEAQLKLDKVTIELEQIKRAKLELNPHKARKRLAPPINHAEKPKKSFHHPKLEYIYGEIVCSPYLTPPLENYPKEVFKVIEDLRELKRNGVKSISKLPKTKQPYDVKKIRNTFIKDVINYEVSFLPKGYEEKKAKADKLLQLEKEWERQQIEDLKEILGPDKEIPSILRPSTTNGSLNERPKSQILQANIARGGPDKYNYMQKQSRKKKKNMTKEQRVKEMTEACEEVEREARRQRLAAIHEKERLYELKAVAQERAVAVDDDIHRFKDKAYRIKRSVVTRSERVSSPQKLIERRFQEFDDDDYGKRGRSRSPPRLKPPTEPPMVFNKSTGILMHMGMVNHSSVNTPTTTQELSTSPVTNTASAISKKSSKKTKSDSLNNNIKHDNKDEAEAEETNLGDFDIVTDLPESFQNQNQNQKQFEIVVVVDDDYGADNDFEYGEMAIEEPDLSAFGGDDGEYGTIDDEFETAPDRPETNNGGGRGGRPNTVSPSNIGDINKHTSSNDNDNDKDKDNDNVEEDFPDVDYETAEFENENENENEKIPLPNISAESKEIEPPQDQDQTSTGQDKDSEKQSQNQYIDDFDQGSDVIADESKGGESKSEEKKSSPRAEEKEPLAAPAESKSSAIIASVVDEESSIISDTAVPSTVDVDAESEAKPEPSVVTISEKDSYKGEETSYAADDDFEVNSVADAVAEVQLEEKM
jgi:hypothetical protein